MPRAVVLDVTLGIYRIGHPDGRLAGVRYHSRTRAETRLFGLLPGGDLDLDFGKPPVPVGHFGSRHPLTPGHSWLRARGRLASPVEDVPTRRPTRPERGMSPW